MHPVLFELFGTTVTAYGAALGIAFAIGIGLAMRRADRAGLDADVVLEAGLVALFSSLLGGRLLFAFENPELWSGSLGWGALLAPLPTGGMKGLSMSLGVLLAVVLVIVWLRVRRQPILQIVDVMAPYVLLGEAITRVGCFMNGCCHGIVCDWPWGVRFPSDSFAAMALGDIAVHPTQLYTVALSLLGFGALLRLAKSGPPTGAVFFGFLTLWSVTRLAVDCLRFYPDLLVVASPLGWDVYMHQVIVLGLAIAGTVGLVSRRTATVQVTSSRTGPDSRPRR